MEEDKKLCGCGTLKEAISTAEKLYVEAAAADCPIWALQVASAFASIANRVMAGIGFNTEELASIAVFMSDETGKQVDPVALLDQTKARIAQMTNRIH